MNAPQSIPASCPQCGATVAATSSQCSGCGAAIAPVPAATSPTLTDSPKAGELSRPEQKLATKYEPQADIERAQPVNPFSAPAAIGVRDETAKPPRVAYTISLQVLMALITVVAVSTAIAVKLPGLGILIGILATPALVRAAWAMNRRRLAGLPVIFEDRMGAFLASLGIMLATLMSFGIAFTIICFPLGLAAFGSGADFGVVAMAIVAGAVIASVVAFLVFRRIGPLRHYDTPPRRMGHPSRLVIPTETDQSRTIADDRSDKEQNDATP